MSDNKFSIHQGEFICKKCKEVVSTMRFWFETGDVTWMCSNKHLSKVELVVKKKKKRDFENE